MTARSSDRRAGAQRSSTNSKPSHSGPSELCKPLALGSEPELVAPAGTDPPESSRLLERQLVELAELAHLMKSHMADSVPQGVSLQEITTL